jgi:tetratricopeptide (TPR) repeat protein
MVIARQAPQICPPMIPFCSRFDSVLFTPKMPAIAGRFNFSRSPYRLLLKTVSIGPAHAEAACRKLKLLDRAQRLEIMKSRSEVMKSACHSGMTALIALVSLYVAPVPGMAQKVGIGAIYERFNQLYDAGNFAAALVEAQKFEAAAKTQFGTGHTNYAVALDSLASVYRAQSKYSEAEGYFKRALAIEERVRGANHPEVAKALNNLAWLYKEQGRYSEAEGLYKRALAIREKAFGANHADVVSTLNNLALVYEEQGRYSERPAIGREPQSAAGFCAQGSGDEAHGGVW